LLRRSRCSRRPGCPPRLPALEAHPACLPARLKAACLGACPPAQLEKAQKRGAELQKALEQQHDLIAALAGRFPSEAGAADLKLADFTLPATLPISLPSQLVDQRPDIRAAEANLHAASAAVGVAVADRLPNITLTASLGGASTELQGLLSPGNQAWSVAGGLTQPLFRGGALLHRQKAAEAAYDQARAQYRSTVIAAFRNVSDVLAAIRHDADSLTTAAAAEQAAQNALSIAEARVRAGQISGASALTIEQAYRSAVATRIQMQVSRLTDTVALFQALGGGWTDQGSD
jgi:NodT family efflux transporter outer membrane factor (OMF) lipoprotein